MVLNDAWVALIAALFGGVILKFIEWFLSRSDRKAKVAIEERNQFKLEIDDLKKERDVAKSREDEWRNKYYELRDKFNK